MCANPASRSASSTRDRLTVRGLDYRVGSCEAGPRHIASLGGIGMSARGSGGRQLDRGCASRRSSSGFSRRWLSWPHRSRWRTTAPVPAPTGPRTATTRRTRGTSRSSTTSPRRTRGRLALEWVCDDVGRRLGNARPSSTAAVYLGELRRHCVEARREHRRGHLVAFGRRLHGDRRGLRGRARRSTATSSSSAQQAAVSDRGERPTARCSGTRTSTPIRSAP